MIVFDIETDGLLDTVSKVHCIVTSEVGTEIYHKYYSPVGIELALDTISSSTVIGHNIIQYDLRVLEKLYPSFVRPTLDKTIDTLVLSRLAWPDRTGGHSLEAWTKYFASRGLEVPAKYLISNWSDQSIEDYLERCETDVMINKEVYKFLSKQIQPDKLKESMIWI